MGRKSRNVTKSIFKKKYSAGNGIFAYIIIPVILFLLAYFTTTNIEYGLAMVLLYYILHIFGYIGFVPVIGLISYLAVSYFWLIPKMLEFMSVEYSWIVTAILLYNSLLGIVITGVYIILKRI